MEDHGTTNPDESAQSLWPLMYLEADWPASHYEHFDLGVRLIRPDVDTLRTMRDVVKRSNARFPGEYVLDQNVNWLLAIRLPSAIEHIPAAQIGMSFRERVEQAVVGAFLSCLRLQRPTAVISPIHFQSHLRSDRVDVELSEQSEDYYIAEYDRPSCEWQERFTQDDMTALTELWSAMVRLRGLRRWLERPFREEVFAKLDASARTRTQEDVHGLFKDSPLDEHDQKEIARIMAGLSPERYAENFRRAFDALERDHFRSQTRLGRAIEIFDAGLHQAPLHNFISMCIVMETLFTLDNSEVTHKLATRLAKIVAQNGSMDERKKYHGMAREVYKERCNVVHGSKSITHVREDVRRTACSLVRLSLTAIMCQDDIFPYFVEGGDEKLKRFYEELDLGTA